MDRMAKNGGDGEKMDRMVKNGTDGKKAFHLCHLITYYLLISFLQIHNQNLQQDQ